jgi:predicted ATPase/transcriptional regulator with XRE-family HTH domain
MDVTFSFGYWLRRQRLALDLTQAALAHCVGCAPITLRKIEADERRPSRRMAQRLAFCLHLPPPVQETFIACALGERPVDALLLADKPNVDVLPEQLPLPVFHTPLIGRTAEATAVEKLIRQGSRLITIVGPGGIGKTRLALAVAERVASRPEHPQPVYFVELTGLTAVHQIIPALAAVLRCPLAGNDRRSPQGQLLDFLRDKRLLLLLDNFEHLREGGDELVADILSQAAGVQVLVTSRERLYLQVEQVMPLAGLAFPSPGKSAGVAHYQAVQLFVQTAVRYRPDFNLAADDWLALAHICHLVAGIPLALELAAAWVDTLSLATIAAEIEANLDFLTSDAPDMPERHRSMRAVFDASWQRLSADGQQVLSRLSLFRGGFTRGAAQAVAGASVPLLAGLVRRSLLQYRRETDRYDLHELLRQYAAEKLALNTDVATAVGDQHCFYFCAALEKWGDDLKGPHQLEALAEMEMESDNLYAAWQWAVRRRHLAQLLQAADGLGLFYERHGRFTEGDAAFGTAVAALNNLPHTAKTTARLLAWHGVFQQVLVNTGAATRLLQQSLALLAGLSPTDTCSERAFALWRLGIYTRHSQLEAAQAWVQESLALYRELGDVWGTAETLTSLANLFVFAGEYAETERLLQESLTLKRSLGNQYGMADSLNLLAFVAKEQGRLAEAEQWLHETLLIFRTMNARKDLVDALVTLGDTLAVAGKFIEARKPLLEAQAISADLGYRSGWAISSDELGYVAVHAGEYALARTYSEPALTVLREIDHPFMTSICLDTLGLAALGDGRLSAAIALLTESVTHLRRQGIFAFYSYTLVHLSLAEFLYGQHTEAAQHLAEAWHLAMQTGNFRTRISATAVRALFQAAQGEVAQAVTWLSMAAQYPYIANSRLFTQLVTEPVMRVTAVSGWSSSP